MPAAPETAREASRIVPAGETGRLLGLTHAVRFPPPAGEWGWIPDEGRLLAPADRPAVFPEPRLVEEALVSLPVGAALVGPATVGEEERADVIAALFRRFGWGVLNVVSPESVDADDGDPLRRAATDGLACGSSSARLPVLRPAIPPAGWILGTPEERDWIAPLEAGAENHRLVVRWAEETGKSDGEAIFSLLFGGSGGAVDAAAIAARLRPLEWPGRFPSPGSWLGTRLRVEAARRGIAGNEAEEAELLAAARRIEALVPSFGKVLEAGLVEQVPGLGERALAEILRLVGESGGRPRSG